MQCLYEAWNELIEVNGRGEAREVEVVGQEGAGGSVRFCMTVSYSYIME